jgi:chromate transporter
MQQHDPLPGNWRLFRIWATIGLQSFGGGASTTFLIQRAFIDRYAWLSMEEFTHQWSLSVLTPGINLVALTILIGRKLGGGLGIAASLAGLLLPSALITCLLAALFVQIEHFTAVQAILRGVVPATGGIMLLVGVNFALPILRAGQKEGIFYLLGSIMVVLACALAVILLKFPVITVVLAAVCLGALFFAPGQEKPLPEQEQGADQ